MNALSDFATTVKNTNRAVRVDVDERRDLPAGQRHDIFRRHGVRAALPERVRCIERLGVSKTREELGPLGGPQLRQRPVESIRPERPRRVRRAVTRDVEVGLLNIEHMPAARVSDTINSHLTDKMRLQDARRTHGRVPRRRRLQDAPRRLVAAGPGIVAVVRPGHGHGQIADAVHRRAPAVEHEVDRVRRELARGGVEAHAIGGPARLAAARHLHVVAPVRVVARGDAAPRGDDRRGGGRGEVQSEFAVKGAAGAPGHDVDICRRPPQHRRDDRLR
mmetsp:Transcript_26507/g.82514  ORF Transcript_26507/g.82514 Transcript_26507/m.82514 type:complete len:276 (+) Transcript_26507:849-1676(+)